MNNLGHYAKQALKAVMKPVNTAIALLTISAALSFNSVQAQSNNFKDANFEVTETGYGNLFIKNENDQGIEGATVTWTPVSIPGDSIPNPYEFISNNVGISSYEVLVFHDTGVGVQNDYNIEVVQSRPNPASDFTLNFITEVVPINPVRITNMSGQLIDEIIPTSFSGNVVVYHADLSDRADGFYSVAAVIGNEVYTNKLVKVGTRTVGNLGSSAKSINNSNFKSTQVNEAIYDVTVEAEGYYTIVNQRIVTDGDQGNDFYTLISDEPPPIDNIDFSGIVVDPNNNNSPINNASIEVVSSGVVYSANSTSNGSFTVNGIPLGDAVLFRAGGVFGKGSVSNFPFTTPSEIVYPADSVNAHWGVVLPDNPPASTTWDHVRDQNLHGTHQDTIWFYLGNSFNTTQKNTIRNYFIQLQADENDVYIYAEKFAASNTGINIEAGTYNTNPYEDAIHTPLGNVLNPVLYATSTMGVGNYNGFVHESKLALGYDIVAWAGVNSVMETPVQDFTLEDKDIARAISRLYWNSTYDGFTNIPMEYLAEDMTSKNINFEVKDVKARIDELKKIAEEKAKANQATNNTDDVEMNGY